MAEETHVLFHGKLPGRAALNRAMKELGFPLVISPGIASLEGHSGYLPMTLRREETGVEFDVFEGRDAVEELAGKDADPRFERSGSFRWGGDENEMLAGLCGAAALAKLIDGIVLDEAENRLLTVDQAIERARETVKAILPPSDGPRDTLPGTRPADIKRYLKPLLKERDDLVLVGRWLFIRPVRHLMRGAFLDRTSDRFSFRVYRTVKPLYGSPGTDGYGDRLHEGAWQVWQPHFQGLLMAMLAEDVFGLVGKITTFSDFADYLPTQQRGPAAYEMERITALVLAGEQDRAAEWVKGRRRELGNAYSRINEHWETISRDIGAICARLHDREAKLVKALKLEQVWEPSPFPVELPAGDRRKVSECGFPTKPWVTDPPLQLRGPPDNPGEVRFAKSFVLRRRNLALLAPLTRQEAEQRHRESEDYVFAARRPDGSLLTMTRSANWDQNMPKLNGYPTGPGRPRLWLDLNGLSHKVSVTALPHDESFELLQLWNICVSKRRRFSSNWQVYLDFTTGELKIHDPRDDGSTKYTSLALSPAMRDVALCPMPTFGEYEELIERTRTLLRIVGYGEVA